MPRVAEREGGKSGARAGKHVDARRADNYTPPAPPLFALRPRVDEIEPFIHTYPAWDRDQNSDEVTPPRGAPDGARFDAD